MKGKQQREQAGFFAPRYGRGGGGAMVREKEHAVVTEAGKRADLGWESRGWKFTQEELTNPPSLRDNM